MNDIETREVCLRCGRVQSDLIHDNPNDYGWTGTSAMHPFVDERGKWLLQWTAKNVFLHGKSGWKGRRLTDDQVQWNEAIGKAESAVAEMFAPLTSEALAEHDRYFAHEYAERAALAPSPAALDLDPIKARFAVVQAALRNNEMDLFNPAHHALWEDIDDLLAEVERLRALSPASAPHE